jgi:hypothetical protein
MVEKVQLKTKESAATQQSIQPPVQRKPFHPIPGSSPVQTKQGQQAPIQTKQGQQGTIQTKQGQQAPIQTKQGQQGAIKSNQSPIQTKKNSTGLPDQLKTGIENLSGHSMDDVKVHYNSSKPAQLKAHAYAQGTDIHVASGQERHLPHEAWHVVQQKQGRVQPTKQMKGNVAVNDDKGLEHEADVMGAKAIQMKSEGQSSGQLSQKGVENSGVAQRQAKDNVAQLARGERTVDGEEQEPYIIRLELPGSGDRFWRSNSEETTAESARHRIRGENDSFRRERNDRRAIYTISGPGSEEGNRMGGIRDNGTNSIANNIRQAQRIINFEMRQLAPGRQAQVSIKAHSRNAVAGSQIATWTKQQYPESIVDYVGFDPVPGPGHDGADDEHNIGTLDHSTVIYSVHTQYPVGFTPQKLLGAKRLIISTQEHGGGLMQGYRFGGEVYTGHNITSLPEGIFLDLNAEGENRVPLRRIDLSSQADLQAIEDAIPSWFRGQIARHSIVRDVVADFVGARNPQ